MRTPLPLRLLAFSFFIASFTGYSQTPEKVKVKVKQSTDKNAEVKNLAAWDVIASGSNSVMVFRKQQGTSLLPSITRLDAYSKDKLMALGSQEPVKKVDGNDLLMEALVYFAGKPMTIGTVRAPKSGQVTVFATEVDPSLARPAGTPMQLCVLEGLKVKGAGSPWIQGNNFYTKFLVRVSGDSSHMAVFSPELRDPDSGMAAYAIAVFDKELKTVWQGNVEVMAGAKESWLSSALVDNKGVVHVAISANKPDPSSKNGNMFRELNVTSADGTGASTIKVPLDAGMPFYRAELVQLADGTTLFTGTFGARSNSIEGFICGRVAKGSSTLDQVQRYAIDNEGVTQSFDIIGVMPRSDGGYYIASEVYRGLDFDTYTRSIYGDVVVLSIDGAGKQEWKSVFRNQSAYENPGISGRRPVVYNDQLFLFMVDTEKLSAKRKSGKEMVRGDMGDPYHVYVAFDPTNGETRVKTILKSEKDIDFIADDIVRVGPNTWFSLTLEGMMGGRYNPVTIEFSMEEGK